MEIRTDLFLGDCNEMLKKLPDNSVDLIITSPPYADQRKGTYGGIHPDKYVEWFIPITKELLRVLKPTGTFILNALDFTLQTQNLPTSWIKIRKKMFYKL
jgi:site-specific DNA-methyltransferase (adenine-specific)